MKEKTKKQMKKKVRKAKKFDPFKLDGTKYAHWVLESMNTDFGDEEAQERATEADLATTDAHPLREDEAVEQVVEKVLKLEDTLYKRRYPRGGVGDDAYFCFEEELVLRPEVTAKITLDYIRAHPELL